jgi:outer membrane protein assembly factor BamB
MIRLKKMLKITFCILICFLSISCQSQDIIWKYQTSGYMLPRDRFEKENKLVFLKDNTVNCIDIGSGKILWKRKGAPVLPDSIHSVYLRENKIYFDSDQSLLIKDGNQILVTEFSTGRIKWRKEVSDIFDNQGSTIVGMKGMFLFKTNQHLISLDSETGTEKWRREIKYSDSHRIELTSLSLSWDRYLITTLGEGLSDDPSGLIVLDTRTGKEIWSSDSLSLVKMIHAYAAVGKNSLFYVTTDSDRIWLHCVSIETGSEKWRRQITTRISQGMIRLDWYADSIFFFGFPSEYHEESKEPTEVSAWNPEGQLRWSHTIDRLSFIDAILYRKNYLICNSYQQGKKGTRFSNQDFIDISKGIKEKSIPLGEIFHDFIYMNEDQLVFFKKHLFGQAIFCQKIDF